MPQRAPGVIEGDARDMPLYERGSHKQPGETVPRRFLEAFDSKPFKTNLSGRLELAEAMLRPDNPLVARVIVNRVWHHLFGRGLVGTPDNFTNPDDVGFDYFFGYVNMWHAHNFYPEFLIRNGKVVKLQNEVAPKWKKWQDPKLPQAGRGVAAKRVEYAPDLFAEDALRFTRENHQRPFFLYFAMNVQIGRAACRERG